jgi:hypothetical protein
MVYLKTLAALALKRDRAALRFALSLRSYIVTYKLSALNILFQIDQHDFAVKNVGSLAEHPYDLDVPSWQERLAAERVGEPVGGAAG